MVKIQAAARLQVVATSYVSGPVEMVFGDEAAHPAIPAKNAKALDNIQFGRNRKAFEATYGPKNFMRMGHFSVVLTRDGDIGVAKIYTDTLMDASDIKPGSDHWESSKDDRMDQIKRVGQVLKKWSKHRLAKELKADMKAEIDYKATEG